MIDRLEFLTTVFSNLSTDETPCFCPNYGSKMTFGPGLEQRLRRKGEWLFCVSSVAPAEKIRSRMQDVRRAYVLPLDDIGTKSRAPDVPPSYVLETSEGNYQWGYLLEPFDVSTDRGANYYDGCLVAMADEGMNDAGCRSATRMVKLPGAVHRRTGFEARVVEWHPERRWELKKLMRAFGVKAQRVTRVSSKEGQVSDLAKVVDPLYDWLAPRLRGHNDTFVYLECPWSFEHSSASAATATGYSPLDYGLEGRQFKCMHGHCQRRGVTELIAWAATQGFDASQLDDIAAVHTRIIRSIA